MAEAIAREATLESKVVEKELEFKHLWQSIWPRLKNDHQDANRNCLLDNLKTVGDLGSPVFALCQKRNGQGCIPDNSANIGQAAVCDLVESLGEILQLCPGQNQTVVHGTGEATSLCCSQVLLIGG